MNKSLVNNMELHWEVETQQGLLLIEGVNEFPKEDQNLKRVYFADKIKCYGINNDLTFFINHETIDLKLKQNVINFFQYKTAKQNLCTNENSTAYNIGVMTEDNQYTYKYTMCIETSGVCIIAEKFENNIEIDSRILKVR